MSLTEAVLSEELLTLPAGRTADVENSSSKASAAPSPAQLEALLRFACDRLRDGAATGEPAYTAARSLQPDNADLLLPPIAAALAERLTAVCNAAGRALDPSLPLESKLLIPIVYEHAVDSVAAGHIETAIVLLGALLHWKTAEADGLLGLAVCAARQERYDAALTLANECLRLGTDHPRAYCIAGLCELKRGDRRAAQNFLAAAARMARRAPIYRDELRAAQRLLIMMHFS
jgi:tetratricopeptide (TPR) repeat protein